MLNYLINTSIIWLCCLALYELWFKKESFHQLNRLFLVFSFLSGLIIPSLQVPDSSSDNPILPKPITQVYHIKHAMQESALQAPSMSGPSMVINTEVLLWSIYLLGVLIGLLLLLREIGVMIQFYKVGNKQRENGCIVIETGQAQSPFSFFHLVFIRSRQEYTTEQWAILLNHEKEHYHQWHGIDNLLFIMVRWLFWFHPLPYLYYQRLRVVHEFQADQAASADTLTYGSFLLEQNFLQRAPILTHSFNYSPIKIRIAMLTKTRSSPIKRLKYVSLLPVFFLLVLCCSETSFSKSVNKDGKKVNFKHNRIELGEFKVVPFEHLKMMQQQQQMFLFTSIPDSFPLTNRATNELIRMEATGVDIMPISINGKPIYGKESQYLLPVADMNYTDPVYIGAEKSVEQVLFNRVKKEIEKLDDGSYVFRLRRLVVDDQGQIAYYDHPGMDLWWSENEHATMDAGIKKRIDQVVMQTLESAIKFKPALKAGKPINVRLKVDGYEISVKNHHAKLLVRAGC